MSEGRLFDKCLISRMDQKHVENGYKFVSVIIVDHIMCLVDEKIPGVYKW